MAMIDSKTSVADEANNEDADDLKWLFVASDLSSGEEQPKSEWASLESEIDTMRTRSFKDVSSERGAFCDTYIPVSDSTIQRHVYYKYPTIQDPGIKEALLAPEPVFLYPSDGQKRYLDLCTEMNLCPVGLFYKNLLSSEINLSYYGVQKKGIYAMTLALENNQNVTRLNLTENFLNNDACYHLGQLLTNNYTLQELILTGCRIRASGFFQLSDNLHRNRTLITLDLARNQLDNEGGVLFTKTIAAGSLVQKVNLSKNNLGPEFCVALADNFEWRNPLTHLDLSWNDFHHVRSTVKMLNRLSNSFHLKEINLSFNALQGEVVAAGILELLNIPSLQLLDLSFNQLKGEAVNIIGMGLKNAKELKTLNLSFNPMSPEDAYKVLQKMFLRKVKLQNLLMENICVEKSFLDLLARVSKLKRRKNFVAVYGDVLHNWTIQGPDRRTLLLNRADYLSKRKLDIILLFLKLNKENQGIMLKETFIDRMENLNVPLSESYLNELCDAFAGPKRGKYRTLDLQAIKEYIERLWPDKKLAPTPPPAPPVIPQPPPPKQKQKKKKVKINIKEDPEPEP